jgi:5-methyltetrahydropteroyltriglutamate--homocysteine methyltransferase
VGSHARPAWYVVAAERIAAGDFGPIDIQESEDGAVDAAILAQERAGIDIITDGEMRRPTGYFRGFYARFPIRELPPARRIGPVHYDTQPRYQLTGRIDPLPEGLGLVAAYQYLSAHTTRAVKVSVPGPATFATPLDLGGVYRDAHELVWDWAAVINAELRTLQAAGAAFIQLDDPGFKRVAANSAAEAVALFNRCFEGITVKKALHVCFGTYMGKPRMARTYRPMFPAVLDVQVDQLVFEFAGRELAEVELWREFAVSHELGAGVIDQRRYDVETPDEVAARIRKLLAYVPAEKLWLNPDCGFGNGNTAFWIANAKLRALAAGAAIVRRELTGA